MTDTMQHRVERRGRTALAWAASDTGAIWAFRIALAISALVYWVVGRRQWFIRDDWAFLLSRQALRVTRGIDDWLLTAQDGHWMTPPLLIFRGLRVDGERETDVDQVRARAEDAIESVAELGARDLPDHRQTRDSLAEGRRERGGGDLREVKIPDRERDRL